MNADITNKIIKTIDLEVENFVEFVDRFDGNMVVESIEKNDDIKWIFDVFERNHILDIVNDKIHELIYQNKLSLNRLIGNY